MKSRFVMTVFLMLLSIAALSTPARAQLPNGYGQGISVEVARKLAATAIAEGKKNGWTVAVAIVDTAGDLVFFERMDNTQAASTIVSQEKARTAARFKRPTKAFEDALGGGRQAILGLPGVTPLEGGLPLVIEGKIVGAIGVSGATSPQDGVCAQAAADTLGKQPAPKPPATPAPPVKK
ncbi:MAG: GlcG/HbpS family heme-binding protein [bacterium]